MFYAINVVFVCMVWLHCQAVPLEPHPSKVLQKPALDVPPRVSRNATFDEDLCVTNPGTFKCKWFFKGGANVDSPTRPGPGYVQVAATTLVSELEHEIGTEVINAMCRGMPDEVFSQVASDARVGLFDNSQPTTIFPEYEIYADTPQCAGRCDGECQITCTGDGRKYDSLAGVGGVRGTCVDVNFMCYSDDPYGNQYSVLVHEFAHTVHGYGIPAYWQNYIYDAWSNAYAFAIWDLDSYAMSNDYEYFAEGAGVYFNVNFHGASSGGMNSCGKSSGFCADEYEARSWLYSQDIYLYTALYNIFGDDYAGMTVCP